MQKVNTDWSTLPGDLLTGIAGLLDADLADLESFRSVCRSWRAAALALLLRGAISFRSPLLLAVSGHASAYSVVLHDPLRPGRRRRAVSRDLTGWKIEGSSHGFLILLRSCESTVKTTLLNPTTGVEVPLPDHDVAPVPHYKMVLSGSPLSPGCVVIWFWLNCPCCGCHSTLFCRVGVDGEWRRSAELDDCDIYDMIFLQGKLYALLRGPVAGWTLEMVDLPVDSGDVTALTTVGRGGEDAGFGFWSLAAAQGELLLKYAEGGVLKFDFADGRCVKEPPSLMHAALFFSGSCFVGSVDVDGGEPRYYFKPNYVYSTGLASSWSEQPLEDGGTAETHYVDGRPPETSSRPMAWWIFPTLVQ